MNTYINPYILKLIEKAIAGEAEDYVFYTALAEKCPDNAEMLNDIAADELKHKKMLDSLYEDLTGAPPSKTTLNVSEDISGSCADIFKDRVKEELDGAAMYRTLYFALHDKAYKNMIFEIMTDEIMHAIRLGALS